MTDEPHVFHQGKFYTKSEFEALVQEEHDRFNMSSQANTHTIQRLFEELDPDKLFALDMVLFHCVVDPAQLAYYRGRVEQTLYIKHEICPCGLPHDPSVLFEEEDDETQPARQSSVEVPNVTEQLTEYGIEPDPKYGKPYPEDSVAPQPFRCINCGMGYRSLSDRMLKPPGIGGCSGCQQKSAWG